MKQSIYYIDAFAGRLFEGNPAAVVPLEEWLSHEVMQSIAEENNLSETAFYVPTEKGFHIRWFTPNKEVKLCGHATLAAAFVLFDLLEYPSDSITFDSLSGPLSVIKNKDMLTLDFPRQSPEKGEMPQEIIDGLGQIPMEYLYQEDHIAVFESQEDVATIVPNHESLKKLDRRGVIITAPGEKYDFVVRFFAPQYGIPEDPVTGSAYTQLMPYWAKRLGKNELHAKQISRRGGDVFCELKGDRVLISGRAKLYLTGTIDRGALIGR